MKGSAKNIIQEEDMKELEHFFKIASMPNQPIVLDPCSHIINAQLFVRSHLSILKAQKGNKRYLPYLDRIKRFKYLLTNRF